VIKNNPVESYIDITIPPDPEFPIYQLMSALFRKLHGVLVKLERTDIGVSFPAHSMHGLGNCLRLHGTAETLQIIKAEEWLSGVFDHVRLSDVTPIPESAKFRTVCRVQVHSSPERLRRRAIKRRGINQEQAIATIPDSAAKTVSLPYIELPSGSTGQHFRIFVRHGTVQDEPHTGKFSSYGFSAEATVPWF